MFRCSLAAALLAALLLPSISWSQDDELMEVDATEIVPSKVARDIEAADHVGDPAHGDAHTAVHRSDLHDGDLVSSELHDGVHHGDTEGPGLLSVDFGSAIWNLIIFLGVLAILSTFVWPQILSGLKAREDKIREDLQSAEAANKTAQANLASYQSQLDDAGTKVSAMIAQARMDAEAAGQRIIDDAKAEAATQRQRALAEIDNAKKVALAELADETSAMAMSVARSVVGRELRAEDHADLIRDAMQRMPSAN